MLFTQLKCKPISGRDKICSNRFFCFSVTFAEYYKDFEKLSNFLVRTFRHFGRNEIIFINKLLFTNLILIFLTE